MGIVNMIVQKKPQTTALQNAFIDKYMLQANSTFAVIYIYIYRHSLVGGSLTTKDISDAFGILESDVVNCFKYWEKTGLLKMISEENDFRLEFLDIPEKIPEQVEPEKVESKKVEPKSEKLKESDPQAPVQCALESLAEAEAVAVLEPPKRKMLILETKPQYAVDELEIYKKDSADVTKLFSMGEQALGKLLTYNDLNVLFGIYDWLRLPLEVIELLLNYCSENNHRNMRYIEKVAIDWAEHEINTTDAATEYIKTFNTEYREILKAFGQSRRDPTATEVGYMKKWLHDYEMPMTIIFEACDKTIMQTGQGKFPYADKILADWKSKGVKTIEDIKIIEEKYYEDKVKKPVAANGFAAPAKRKTTETKPNRFVNFEQREWDYEKIEQLEQAYLKNSLRKG